MADSLLALVGSILGVLTLVLLRGGADPVVWVPAAVVALAVVLFAFWDGASAPVVLVVGEAAGADARRLESALEWDGMTVRRCTGPAERDCPVEAGQPCPYGHHLGAALVHGAHDGRTDPPCERGLDAPVLYYDVTAAGRPVVRGGPTPESTHGPEDAVAQAVRQLVS